MKRIELEKISIGDEIIFRNYHDKVIRGVALSPLISGHFLEIRNSSNKSELIDTDKIIISKIIPKKIVVEETMSQRLRKGIEKYREQVQR